MSNSTYAARRPLNRFPTQYHSDIGELLKQSLNLTRPFQTRLGPEHVEQIACNTNQVVTRPLLDQPAKPMKTKMEIGCEKNFHASTNGKEVSPSRFITSAIVT